MLVHVQRRTCDGPLSTIACGGEIPHSHKSQVTATSHSYAPTRTSISMVSGTRCRWPCSSEASALHANTDARRCIITCTPNPTRLRNNLAGSSRLVKHVPLHRCRETSKDARRERSRTTVRRCSACSRHVQTTSTPTGGQRRAPTATTGRTTTVRCMFIVRLPQRAVHSYPASSHQDTRTLAPVTKRCSSAS